jgi:GT2 family glycosyltransferase
VLQPEDWDVPTEHTEHTEAKERGAQAGSRPTNDTNDTNQPDENARTSMHNPCSRSLPSRPIRVDSCDSGAIRPCSPCAPWAVSLTRDLRFAFNGHEPAWVTNVMAGNLCVKRERALAVGGFDANFTPPVAYRFETEFAKRLVAAGGRIRFEPAASIRHLRASRGGTRSQGSHLNSASPVHGVGDYYFALRCGRGWERAWYMARRPFREVRTRFHLRHPWYIPVKLIGEMRALLLALRLWRQGPRLLR